MNEVFMLDNQDISIENMVAVARDHRPVELSAGYLDRLRRSRRLVDKFVDEERTIYGLTTGFGKNLNYVISRDEAAKLQENIVLSHSAAVGAPLPEDVVRAFMFMVLVNVGQGFSGTSPAVIERLADLLNRGVHPYAPYEGHIGSLSCEAFVALTLIGQGQAYYQGELMDSAQALERAGLKPISLSYKDGLSVISGSTLACAMAGLALYDLTAAANSLLLATAMTFEALEGNRMTFDPRMQTLKKHVDQLKAAETLLAILDGSEILDDARPRRLQDPVMLRVAAHVHGGAVRMIKEAADAVTLEMNSVSDNPVIVPQGDEFKDGVALMGGNFDSTYITLYCDSAALAAAMLAKISDKRVDRLNYQAESHLPSFLTGGEPGLNSGYMIPQYTVAGLFGEISHLAAPISVQSISSCAGHESPVTMATLAADRLLKIASRLQYIAAIELMMAAQAIELRKPARPSSSNRKVLEAIRKRVDPLTDDRFYHHDILAILELIKKNELVASVEAEIGMPLT